MNQTNQEYVLSRVVISVSCPDRCWEWIGGLSEKGYGKCSPQREKSGRAHRLAYKSLIGPIPKGINVCHSCDNRKCCNPNHLWLGTQTDNHKDMVKKGRQRGPGKLTLGQTIEIRQTYNGKRKEFAQRYGVSISTITRIVKFGGEYGIR